MARLAWMTASADNRRGYDAGWPAECNRRVLVIRGIKLPTIQYVSSYKLCNAAYRCHNDKFCIHFGGSLEY
jgi:hypothetical protein